MNLWWAATIAVLALHLTWVLWVIFGALFTRGRATWTWFHVASLVYGIVIEVTAWPCPLTLLENALRVKAGLPASGDPFLHRCLEALVYPDVSPLVLVPAAVSVCTANLLVYAWRCRQALRRSPQRQ